MPKPKQDESRETMPLYDGDGQRNFVSQFVENMPADAHGVFEILMQKDQEYGFERAPDEV